MFFLYSMKIRDCTPVTILCFPLGRCVCLNVLVPSCRIFFVVQLCNISYFYFSYCDSFFFLRLDLSQHNMSECEYVIKSECGTEISF